MCDNRSKTVQVYYSGNCEQTYVVIAYIAFLQVYLYNNVTISFVKEILFEIGTEKQYGNVFTGSELQNLYHEICNSESFIQLIKMNTV
jgi:hypothetical protein